MSDAHASPESPSNDEFAEASLGTAFAETVFGVVGAADDFLIAGRKLARALVPYGHAVWRLNVGGFRALLRGGHMGFDGHFHKGLNPLTCAACFEDPVALGRGIAKVVGRAMNERTAAWRAERARHAT